MEEEIVLAILYLVAGCLVLGMAMMIFFYFIRKKFHQTQLEKQALEITHQRDLIQRLLIFQEQERKRIAEDIHDAVSSNLNLITLNARQVCSYGMMSPEQDRLLESIIANSLGMTENARRIIYNLLPPTLEHFGLQAALRELFHEVSLSKTVHISFANDDQLDTLTKECQLHLFRIVQELVNNSFVHGNAKKIEIIFGMDGKTNTCIYRDDGRGFQYDRQQPTLGLGLQNIVNRLKFMDGVLNIHSSPGCGMEARFKF